MKEYKIIGDNETWNPTINILNDSEIIMDWPHESIFTAVGYIRHPNTEVLVDRGKKECVAVYGESFAWGDNMDSPFVRILNGGLW